MTQGFVSSNNMPMRQCANEDSKRFNYYQLQPVAKQIVHFFYIATLAHYFLYCHIISNDETPENEFPGVCFCLPSLFTEVEQKNFISLL